MNRNLSDILVLGDVMLDHYIEGRVERISPEAPVPVVQVDRDRFMLGGAGNVAANLRSLEAAVVLGGLCGRDAEGRRLLDLLQEQDIPQVLQDHAPQTITKTRIIAGRQQIVRIDREAVAATPPLRIDALLEALDARRIGLLVLSDYHKGSLQADTVRRLVHWAHQQGMSVLIDPKGADWAAYRGATIVTPNLKELGLVYGSALDNQVDKQIAEAAQMVRARYDLEHLLVTRSEKGMTLVDASGGIRHVPTQAQDVFDVTGAGDTVLATLAFGMAWGMSLDRAVAMANHAAGMAVAHLGAYRVQRAQLENFLHEEEISVHTDASAWATRRK